MNGCHIALIGRITRPGELKHLANGNAMLKIGVMIEDANRKEGDPPEYADIVVWGDRAEELVDQVPKGAALYVEGRAKVRPWTGQDGTPRSNLDVSAWKVEVLGQIGRSAPRRPRDETQAQSRRMPEEVAIHGRAGRNTRQQLWLDDPDENADHDMPL